MPLLEFADYVTIGAIVFVAGGLAFQLRGNSKKLDQLVEKDKEHDDELHNHDKRISVVETKIEHQDGRIDKMYVWIEEIYKNWISNHK